MCMLWKISRRFDIFTSKRGTTVGYWAHGTFVPADIVFLLNFPTSSAGLVAIN